jgi:glycosyltransferase involved in cell wall biosynthesis
MKPLVSILIPAYNSEKWIAETLESAIAQTWSNKEIIVVDDGSNDTTFEIVKSFTSENIKIIRHQESLGQCVSENRALKESQGDFIQYLDADDIISKNKIEIQLKRLFEFPDCVASCSWARFYKTVDDALFIPEVVWKDLDPVTWLVEAWMKNPMMQAGIWLIPRKIIGKAGLWDERLSLINDFDYFTRVLLNSKGVRFCPEGKLYYRSGLKRSLSGTKSIDAYNSAFLSLSLGTESLIKYENSKRTRLASATVMQRFIYDVYPFAPDLLKKAEEAVERYGGSDINPAGGTFFKILSFFLGWRNAQRARRFIYFMGYEKLAIGWKISQFIKRIKYRYF